MEYIQITIDQWLQWKEDIRRKLSETASNFVYIGYRLKQIRDSGMYDGAEDIFGFAQKEYGLGKSTVSRFIAINEKYSEGGNSLELREEFKGFSSSKLSEMLTLPDSELQLITEQTTVSEIRELKRFVKEEKELKERQSEEMVTAPAGAESKIPETTDSTEVAMEAEAVREVRSEVVETKDAEWPGWTDFEKCLIHFFSTRKEILSKLMRYLDKGDYKAAAEIMNPSGQSSHRRGIVFIFMYSWMMGVKYKLMTEKDPVSLSWQQFLDQIYQIFKACDRAKNWDDFYGKTAENQGVQGAVATSQQTTKTPEKEAKKSEKTKEENHDQKPEKRPASAERLKEKPESKADCVSDKEGGQISTIRKEVEDTTPEEKKQEECEEVSEEDPKLDEESSNTKPEQVMEEAEEVLKTRKEYLDSLTCWGAACYLAMEFEIGRVDEGDMRNPRALEEWLSEAVDKAGKPTDGGSYGRG